MSIKYTKDYSKIIDEMTDKIINIDGFYSFFDMSMEKWHALDQKEKNICLKTMCDDIFYILNFEEEISVSDSTIKYNKNKNIIEIVNNKEIYIVKLY